MSLVLVTGGCGYVGGRLCLHLLRIGVPVRVTTRRDEASLPSWTKAVEVVRADLLDPQTLAPATEDVSVVIHLAALDRDSANKDPGLALRVNGDGTEHLLTASVAAGVRRFIYLSTYHVYGDLYGSKIDESRHQAPLTTYAESHVAGENRVSSFREKGRLETVIMRLSNAFGYAADLYAMRWELLFNDLCLQAVRTGEMTLRGPTSEARDFICMGDVVKAIAHVLALPERGLTNGVFNLGAGRSFTTLQVAHMIQSEFAAGYGSTPVINSPSQDDGAPRSVDLDVRKLLGTGFTHDADVADEIRGTIELAHRVAGRPHA